MPNQKDEYLKQLERKKEEKKGKRTRRRAASNSSSSSSSSYTYSDESGEDSDSVVTLDDSEADSDMLKGPLLEVVKKKDAKYGGKERSEKPERSTKAAPSELDAGGDSDEERREADARRAPECINLESSDNGEDDEEEIVDAFSCADGSPDAKRPNSMLEFVRRDSQESIVSSGRSPKGSMLKLLEPVPPAATEDSDCEEIVEIEVTESKDVDGTDPEDEIEDNFTEDALKDRFDDIKEEIDIKENDIISDTPREAFEEEEVILNSHKIDEEEEILIEYKHDFKASRELYDSPQASPKVSKGILKHSGSCHLCSFVPSKPSRHALYGHIGAKHFRKEILASHGASPSCVPCKRDFLTTTALVHHLAATHNMVERFIEVQYRIPDASERMSTLLPKERLNKGRYRPETPDSGPVYESSEDETSSIQQKSPLVVKFNKGKISESMRMSREAAKVVKPKRPTEKVVGKNKDSGWILERSPEKSPRGGTADPFQFEEQSPERLVFTLRRSTEARAAEEPGPIKSILVNGVRRAIVEVNGVRHSIEGLVEKARRSRSSASVKLARMSRGKFLRLSEEQAAYERKLLAVRPPQLSLEASSAQKSSSALIFRILASLQRRFQATGEICSVGNGRMDRQGFDNHNEVERAARVAPRQVPNNIEMDFAAYFKSSTVAADKVNTDLFIIGSLIRPSLIILQLRHNISGWILPRQYFNRSLRCGRRAGHDGRGHK